MAVFSVDSDAVLTATAQVRGTADRLQADAGYAKGTTATNTRDQTLEASTVYYGEGFRSQGRAVGRLLGIDTIEPVDEKRSDRLPASGAGGDRTHDQGIMSSVL